MTNIFKKITLQKPEKIFVIFILFFGLQSTVLVPQLINNDENMHFLRTYSLSKGVFTGKNCTYPIGVKQKEEQSVKGEFSLDFTDRINDSKEVRHYCGTAASYSPIMHLPQTLGFIALKPFNPTVSSLILAGRISNLLFYTVVMYFVIKKVIVGKWTFFVISLLPFMVQTASSLSADVMANTAMLACVAYAINLFFRTNKLHKKDYLIFFGISIYAMLTKPTNLFVLLPLAFLPRTLFRENPKKFKWVPFSIYKWLMLAGGAIIAVTSLYIWQKIYGGSLISQIPAANPLHSRPWHFLKILFTTYLDPTIGYTDLLLRGVVGDFASYKYHLPTYMVMLCYSLLLLTLIYKPKNDQAIKLQPSQLRVYTIANIASLLILVIAITYTLYTTWAIQPYRLGYDAKYADGVQGRYFTSSLSLLIIPALWLRKYIFVSTTNDKFYSSTVIYISLFILFYYIAETIYYFTIY